MAKSRLDLDSRMMGAEPIITSPVTSANDIRLRDSLRWYGHFLDKSNTKKEIYLYMKNSDNWNDDHIRKVKKVPDNNLIPTYLNLALMHNNGVQFSDSILQRIEGYVLQLLEMSDDFIEAEEVKNTKKKPSIQERMQLVADQYIGQFEDYEETFFETKKLPKIDVYNILSKEQVNGPVTAKILSVYKDKVTVAYSKDAKELIGFTGKRLTDYRKLVYDISEEVERWHNNVKASTVRKPRKRKQKSAMELVKNLNYMKQYQPLQLVSISPSEVIGVEQLWTYNTKTKQLSVYRASGPMSIKGSTLINFDEATSERKKLREKLIKPILNTVLTGGKIKLKRIMEELTTKPALINGRINKDTILLRAVK